jgi:hypothetical protein
MLRHRVHVGLCFCHPPPHMMKSDGIYPKFACSNPKSTFYGMSVCFPRHHIQIKETEFADSLSARNAVLCV